MNDSNRKLTFKTPMRRVILILIILFGSIFAWDFIRYYITLKVVQKKIAPPVTISTAIAKTQAYQVSFPAVGTITAINSVNVTSQQSGQVLQINFQSGQEVQEGQLLVQLDDSQDQQDLKTNQAQLTVDLLDFQRKAALLKQAAVSQSDYDSAKAKAEQSRAAVDKTLVTINQKKIRAPFAGKIGIRQVNLGQYVKPGDSLVSLQSQDPIYINFTLPEQYLRSLYVGQSVAVAVGGYPRQQFYGKINALNSLVTEATRNIQAQATLPNKKHLLYPGTFGNVTVYAPTIQNSIVVPQTAITYSLFGNTIFVVKNQTGKDKVSGKPIFRVEQRVVQVGDTIKDMVVVTNGIKSGEEVVTSGQNKLLDNGNVMINNDVKSALPSIQQEE